MIRALADAMDRADLIRLGARPRPADDPALIEADVTRLARHRIPAALHDGDRHPRRAEGRKDARMIAALRARPDLWRFVKFLVVGVLNTAIGWAIYAVLLRLLGLPWQVALALAYVIGVMWNFFTHARLVFLTRGFGRLPAYVVAYVMVFLLNKWVLSRVIAAGVSELWAQALLLLPMAMVTFVLISLALTAEMPFKLGRRRQGD